MLLFVAHPERLPQHPLGDSGEFSRATGLSWAQMDLRTLDIGFFFVPIPSVLKTPIHDCLQQSGHSKSSYVDSCVLVLDFGWWGRQ